MKKTYHYTSWRLTDKGELCGVNFGYDFCAEHESGIAGIRESFGIKSYVSGIKTGIKKILGIFKPAMGIDARLITVKPNNLQFKQKGDFCCIYYSSDMLVKFSDSTFEDGIKSLSWEMSKPSGLDLCTYWGENCFMVITTNQPYFQTLKKGFNDVNMAIFTAGRLGLVLCLPDKLDDRTKTELYASDLNAWELRIAMDESGIEKELKSAKKEYFALNPAWKNPATKEIWFWMNPCETNQYNHGWFTIDELKEWTKEKGPIIKIKDGNQHKQSV